MSLQIEWQYLQSTVPGVGSLMGPIEDYLREAFFPELFRGGEVSTNLREILGHNVKRVGLGIPDPRLSAERAYNTSKAASEVLVGSLLGGTNLNYIADKGFVCRSSADNQNKSNLSDKVVFLRQKDMADRVGLNRLRQATKNGACLKDITHHHNSAELS